MKIFDDDMEAIKVGFDLNFEMKHLKTSTNVPGRPEGSYLKFYKCLNYIFNNNTFSPI